MARLPRPGPWLRSQRHSPHLWNNRMVRAFVPTAPEHLVSRLVQRKSIQQYVPLSWVAESCSPSRVHSNIAVDPGLASEDVPLSLIVLRECILNSHTYIARKELDPAGCA